MGASLHEVERGDARRPPRRWADRMSRRGFRFALAIGSLLILTASSSLRLEAQAPPTTARTGAELQTRLQSRVSVSLVGSQLRSAALKLAENNDIAVAIDRRVDPETPVDLSFTDTPVADVWRQLAASAKLGYAPFGPLVYLGPPSTARDLNTLAMLRRDEANSAAPDLKRELFGQEALVCEEPCEPREVWKTLVAEAGLRTVNPERMPFDVWPKIKWAPLPLVDRLTLIAAQFGLTFKLDVVARTITFEPIPSDVTLERSYPAGAKPSETLARFRAAAPGASVKLSGTKITVVGKFEDHLQLTAGAPVAKVAAPPVSVPPIGGAQLYTLRVKDVPFGELVRVLQAKHQLKIRIDEAAIRAAGLSLDERTAVDVTKVTLEQLLDQAASPLKLAAKRVGDTVEIGVRAPAPK